MAELQARNPTNSPESNQAINQNFVNQECHMGFLPPNIACNNSQNYSIQQTYAPYKYGGHQTSQAQGPFNPQVSQIDDSLNTAISINIVPQFNIILMW